MENPPVISKFLREEFLLMGARIVSQQLVAFSQDSELKPEEFEKKGLSFYATANGKRWYKYEGTPDNM